MAAAGLPSSHSSLHVIIKAPREGEEHLKNSSRLGLSTLECLRNNANSSPFFLASFGTSMISGSELRSSFKWRPGPRPCEQQQLRRPHIT